MSGGLRCHRPTDFKPRRPWSIPKVLRAAASSKPHALCRRPDGLPAGFQQGEHATPEENASSLGSRWVIVVCLLAGTSFPVD